MTGDQPFFDFPLGSEELLTAAALMSTGRTGMATFEVSVRALPPQRSYLVMAGLDHVVDLLEGFRPSREQLDLLKNSALGDSMPGHVFEWLAQMEFSGEVEAMPEGTVAFGETPLLRLRAPAPQGFMVGSLILSALGYETAVATKVARLGLAAAGRKVFEFAVSSAAGGQASLQASRAAFVGGVSATNNATAALRLGLPCVGVLPLSVLLRGQTDDEVQRAVRSLASEVMVLLDQGHPLDGINQLIALGAVPGSVLVDSGDFHEVPTQLRSTLEDNGHPGVGIYITGGLDEEFIENLVASEVPVDGFGVGGRLATVSNDAYFPLEYNLVEWEESGAMVPVGRESPGRTVRPGCKAVYRRREAGCFVSDTVQPEHLPPPSGEFPLLVPMMTQGKRSGSSPSLGEIRALCASQMQMLDASILRLSGFESYPVYFEGFEVCEETMAEQYLDCIDDSADFSNISSAFEDVVAERLGLDKDGNPLVRDDVVSAADSGPPVEEPEGFAPILQERGTDEVDENLDYLPDEVPAAVAGMEGPAVDLVAPDKATVDSPGEGSADFKSDAGSIEAAAALIRAGATGKEASTPDSKKSSKSTKGGSGAKKEKDSLLSAAAKLKKVQTGDTGETTSSGSSLLGAASRLKSIQGGGVSEPLEPVSASDSNDKPTSTGGSGVDYSGETKASGDALSAVAKPKALTSGGASTTEPAEEAPEDTAEGDSEESGSDSKDGSKPRNGSGVDYSGESKVKGDALALAAARLKKLGGASGS